MVLHTLRSEGERPGFLQEKLTYAEPLKSQKPVGRLHSVAVGRFLTVGQKLKTEIRD